MYFLKNIIEQINFLLKILSTCLVTLSYTLYTSFIAYLLITQLKCLIKRPTFESSDNSSASSLVLQENQIVNQNSQIQNFTEFKRESFENNNQIMSLNENYLQNYNYKIENSTFFFDQLKGLEDRNYGNLLRKSCQLRNQTNFLNYKPFIIFF